jgi:hypothetical protein
VIVIDFVEREACVLRKESGSGGQSERNFSYWETEVHRLYISALGSAKIDCKGGRYR